MSRWEFCWILNSHKQGFNVDRTSYSRPGCYFLFFGLLSSDQKFIVSWIDISCEFHLCISLGTFFLNRKFVKSPFFQSAPTSCSLSKLTSAVNVNTFCSIMFAYWICDDTTWHTSSVVPSHTDVVGCRHWNDKFREITKPLLMTSFPSKFLSGAVENLSRLLMKFLVDDFQPSNCSQKHSQLGNFMKYVLEPT